MRRINYEPANQDMPVTGEILDMVPARRGFSRRGETALGTMVENALIAAGYDHCQALLTKAALEHTGALSCMAARLSNIDPEGTEHYREIVATYVRSAVQRIEGW